MNKFEFYGEQANKFIEYRNKFEKEDILSLFNEWVFSKNFLPEDSIEIWKIVRKMSEIKRQEVIINVCDVARFLEVLEMLSQNDLVRLEKILNISEVKDIS